MTVKRGCERCSKLRERKAIHSFAEGLIGGRSQIKKINMSAAMLD
jgi:hypothetical protein